ncbi:hypothetical protein ACLVWU_11335 [Bdellovibrio sp. HCB290]|uniref:hypothetical protein n=1 Tax=Bdellovibrio sp. HCB290 TaxID=3394356 RepID=UPI0039B5F031
MKKLIIVSLIALGASAAQAAPKSVETKPSDATLYESDDQFSGQSKSKKEISRDRRASSDPRFEGAVDNPGTRDMKDSDGSIKENQ